MTESSSCLICLLGLVADALSIFALHLLGFYGKLYAVVWSIG